jgi:hypothetical protein
MVTNRRRCQRETLPAREERLLKTAAHSYNPPQETLRRGRLAVRLPCFAQAPSSAAPSSSACRTSKMSLLTFPARVFERGQLAIRRAACPRLLAALLINHNGYRFGKYTPAVLAAGVWDRAQQPWLINSC